MLYRLTNKIAAIAFCSLLMPSATAFAMQFTEAEIKTLAEGRMVLRPGEDSGRDSIISGASFIIVNAPPERVWEVMANPSNWRHIFYNTLSVETVGARQNTKLVKMTIGNRLLDSTFYLSVSYTKKKWEMEYELAKGKENDVEYIRGWLHFFPQPGGRTLVAFLGTVKVPFGEIIMLMGESVLKIVEFRVLAVPMGIKRHLEGW